MTIDAANRCFQHVHHRQSTPCRRMSNVALASRAGFGLFALVAGWWSAPAGILRCTELIKSLDVFLIGMLPPQAPADANGWAGGYHETSGRPSHPVDDEDSLVRSVNPVPSAMMPSRV